VLAVGDRGGPCPPWIFILDIDKIEGGLMVLLFSLVFFVAPPPLKIFLLTPLFTIDRTFKQSLPRESVRAEL